MALNDVINVFMYVNPNTQQVEKMVCFTPFGVSERIDADWEPTTRDESGIDDLTADKVYLLDWDSDFLPMDAEDDGKEHAAIELYDNGNLTEADCQKYGKLQIDPTAVSE